MVHSSKPLNYSGAMIEEFSLTFANGRVVKVTAEKGETLLRKLIETDDSAGWLGEIALVPYSSPVSQSGLLFYNTLLTKTRRAISRWVGRTSSLWTAAKKCRTRNLPRSVATPVSST